MVGIVRGVRIDGKELPLHEVTDFAARIENGVLVYEFTLPMRQPIDPGASQFAAASLHRLPPGIAARSESAYFPFAAIAPPPCVRRRREPSRAASGS